MECDVCERHIGPILDGFCFWCVRGVLHGPRQAMVAVLLQREKIVKQIESALGSGDSTYDLHLSDLYGEITKSRRMKESIGQRILSLRTALQTGRRWADERREALSRNRQSQVRFQDDMEKQRETFAVQKSCAIMPDQQAEAIAFEKRRHARQLGRLLSIQHQMTDTLILSNIRIPRLCDLNGEWSLTSNSLMIRGRSARAQRRILLRGAFCTSAFSGLLRLVFSCSLVRKAWRSRDSVITICSED